MKLFVIVTTFLVSFILSPLWRGYVFSKLWLWFIVSTFGVPALSIPAAIGLNVVSGLLIYQYREEKNEGLKPEEIAVKGILIAFFVPLFSLIFGAIVKAWL